MIINGTDKQIQGSRSDRVPEELWTEVVTLYTGGSNQNHPKEKEMQEGKVVV